MNAPLTAKDFASDQEVRWCPGCGGNGYRGDSAET